MITRKTFEDSFETEADDLAADANVREVKDSVRMEFDDWLAANPDVYIAHFSEHSETITTQPMITHGNHNGPNCDYMYYSYSITVLYAYKE